MILPKFNVRIDQKSLEEPNASDLGVASPPHQDSVENLQARDEPRATTTSR
jgi:hypothetical protein